MTETTHAKELYEKGTQKPGMPLNGQQKREIAEITMGITEVDFDLRRDAIEDIFYTLENGNPLNRIIVEEGRVSGYVACEDVDTNEVYVKYFGTNRKTGRDILREFATFLDYAERSGYKKISFHGWNCRLNRVLERFGFQKINDTNLIGAPYYEIQLNQK